MDAQWTSMKDFGIRFSFIFFVPKDDFTTNSCYIPLAVLSNTQS